MAHLLGRADLMGEMLPRAYQMRKFLVRRPDVPVMVKNGTNVANLQRILQLQDLGLKFVHLDENDALYARRAYFPLKVVCGQASRAGWLTAP